MINGLGQIARLNPDRRVNSLGLFFRGSCGEDVDGCGVESFGGKEDGGGEGGMIGGVGEMFGFETEGGEGGAARTVDGRRWRRKTRNIKLQARFGGEDLDCAAGCWIIDFRGQVIERRGAKDEIIVVAVLGRCIGDGMRGTKIIRRALNGFECSGGNAGLIYRSVLVRVDESGISEDGSCGVIGQIEIGVVG
jgi:hypothetical protein